MSTAIKLRGDTTENWTLNSSVILAVREIAVDTDLNRFKIGNGTSTWAQLNFMDKSLEDALGLKANLANPTFTGKVVVPIPNGDTSATQAARHGTLDDRVPEPNSLTLNRYLRSNDDGTSHWSADVAPLASPTFTGTVSGITSSMVGLGNVTNESKSTMFTNPTLTQNITEVLVGTVTSVGSTTITGTGTNFLSFKSGDIFTQIGGPTITFTINTITDDLTLNATANVTSYSGMVGTIARTGPQSVDIIKVNGTRGLEILTEVFADNTAAAALAIGTIYRTSTGVLMIKY